MSSARAPTADPGRARRPPRWRAAAGTRRCHEPRPPRPPAAPPPPRRRPPYPRVGAAAPQAALPLQAAAQPRAPLLAHASAAAGRGGTAAPLPWPDRAPPPRPAARGAAFRGWRLPERPRAPRARRRAAPRHRPRRPTALSAPPRPDPPHRPRRGRACRCGALTAFAAAPSAGCPAALPITRSHARPSVRLRAAPPATPARARAALPVPHRGAQHAQPPLGGCRPRARLSPRQQRRPRRQHRRPWNTTGNAAPGSSRRCVEARAEGDTQGGEPQPSPGQCRRLQRPVLLAGSAWRRCDLWEAKSTGSEACETPSWQPVMGQGFGLSLRGETRAPGAEVALAPCHTPSPVQGPRPSSQHSEQGK